ncbi:MAG: phosphonate ABC transporter, permease protein PhnE [Candidatus Methylomirabilales bacterium]
MKAPTSSPPADFSLGRTKSTFPYLFTLFFIMAFVLSYWAAQVDPFVLFEAQGRQNLRKFVTGMFPPELSLDFLKLMARPAVETLQISIMGTALAVLIGLPFGLLATGSLTWSGVLHEMAPSHPRRFLGFGPYMLARALLSIFRSIPEFVWALMFVRAVGLGPFPGVLAIGVSYGGMLGKVYSEILESVNPHPLEALQATGASKLKIIFYGLLPQAFPNLLSYTLYRWECAIRASAILGFVGAGGIGQQIEISMRMFNFHEILTLVGILALLVAGVDALSARVRKAFL